jgi:hypothetical protein
MSESTNKDTFTGMVMTGRRIKFSAYMASDSVLSKFKIRPSIVPIDEKQDSSMVTAMIYSVIERWADKDLYQILPEFTIERMAMRLAIEIKAALPPGFVLVALELDQGPTRVTVMPSANP